MGYNLRYSDYITSEGPPDPSEWVGPPGPPGPPGPAGADSTVPGPMGPSGVTGSMPEAPTDGTVYGRQGSTGSWIGALPLIGGTVTGQTSFSRSIGANLGTGILLQAGDMVAGMNVPLLMSYKAGAASGAVASLGFNSYYNTAGAGGQRVNATRNAWSLQHDTRSVNDGSLVLNVTSAAGVNTTPFTFNPDGSMSIVAAATGGAMNTPFNLGANLSGTKSSGAVAVSRVNVASDTMNAQVGGGISALMLEYHGGSAGAGSVGTRVGLNIDFNFAGGTSNKSLASGGMYAGYWAYAKVTGNVGGSAGAGNGYGQLWGGLSSANIKPGATFWNTVCAHEFNMGVDTGASCARIQGIKVVITQNQQAAILASDYMIGMALGANTYQQTTTGIAFGSDDGHWPITSTGRLISTIATNALLPGPLSYTAAFGIDFSAVTFSTAFLKSAGFVVDGVGRVSPLLFNAASDAAAAAGGVPIGALYRNAGAVVVRLV